MLDRVGPRAWLTEPSVAEVAARIFWAYIFFEYGSFDNDRQRCECLTRARAWEHWLRVRREN